MSLRYALLAVLRAGPLTGYDLQKVFAQSVGHVWHAPDSQIYPELRRMEADGLVEADEQPRGERGTRREYHVTDEGLAALRDWMGEPLEYSRFRDPAHLRAAYLEVAPPGAARAFLEAHIAHYQDQLEQWQGQLEAIESHTSFLLERRLKVTAEGDREATAAFKRFTYEGLVAQAENEIAWARRGLELLVRLGR